MRPLLRLCPALLAPFALTACPDTDVTDLLPEPVVLAEAVLVPTPEGLLAFPVQADGRLAPPVGFVGNPGDVIDIVQRPDGALFCASSALTIDLPEGFLLEPDGDFLQSAAGGVLNLEDSPNIAQPGAALALPDLSVLVADAQIGETVSRFGADGADLGEFTEQLSFVAPTDLVLVGDQVVIIDAEQDPRLFRFSLGGQFLGAFPSEDAAEAIINPIAAASSSSQLVLVDGLLNLLVRLDAAGNFIDTVGAPELGSISDVTLLPDGSLVVADRGDEERQIAAGLRVFGAGGNLVQQIALPDIEGLDQPRLSFVTNISAHPVR